MRKFTNADSLVCLFDNFIKTLNGDLAGSGRENPANVINSSDLSIEDFSYSGKLMRVNHSGEVAAQALYQGQLFFENIQSSRSYLLRAAVEEADHLRWTSAQLEKLHSHESYLNSFWYVGAFFLGLTAGFSGKKKSLGFLAETERQVAEHLSGHLTLIPENDISSRLIIKSMLADETEHANWAENSKDFIELPTWLRVLMRQGAKVMIFFSYRL